jgi:hemolysin D
MKGKTSAVAKSKEIDLVATAVRSDRVYAEFLPAAIEISARPVPRVVPILLLVLISVIAGTLLWSWFFSLQVFTNAAGRVRATISPTVVQPMEAGRILAIKVENDQHVSLGQPLIILDDIDIRASLDAAKAARYSWAAEVTRRKAALAAVDQADIPSLPQFASEIPPTVVDRELAAFHADVGTIRATLASIAAQKREAEARLSRFQSVAQAQRNLIGILDEKSQMLQGLVAKGSASRGTLLNAREATARAQSDLTENESQMHEVRANLENLTELDRQTRSNFRSDQSQGIQAAERQIEQLDQEVVRFVARLDQRTLMAPVAGTVQQLATTGPGQYVNAGQSLMVIVPDGSELLVDALIPSSDIGFVREGQPVTLKADSYPFTRYGTFSGKVASLSNEAVTADNALALQDANAKATGQVNAATDGLPQVSNLFFVARIALDSPELAVGGGRLKLEPGMTLRAEIETETRRIIDYVLSPVIAVLDEAGHER